MHINVVNTIIMAVIKKKNENTISQAVLFHLSDQPLLRHFLFDPITRFTEMYVVTLLLIKRENVKVLFL